MSVRVGERERVVAIYESPFGTFSIIAAVEFRSKVGQPSSHSALLSQSYAGSRERRRGGACALDYKLRTLMQLTRRKARAAFT